ncbi:VOC family protein [Priestia megaterium]|uniref:VOC family protein n=1 Tax=Priestia megaterium TaxID=1404 RepID=UPI0036D822DA
MINKLGHITILVNDYDEAIRFYTEKMGFNLLKDISFGEGKRWVSVVPPSQNDIALVFVLADTIEKKLLVGKQASDHVFITVETSNCHKTYTEMQNKGVNFYGVPREVPWGLEVVFEDLYGNRFDLVQHNGY